MRRRDIIALLGSFAAAWPLKAEELQQLRTIAIIGNTTQAYGPWAAAFVERLGQLGWLEGRTLRSSIGGPRDVESALPKSPQSYSARRLI
jgi:hypothetical protein